MNHPDAKYNTVIQVDDSELTQDKLVGTISEHFGIDYGAMNTVVSAWAKVNESILSSVTVTVLTPHSSTRKTSWKLRMSTTWRPGRILLQRPRLRYTTHRCPPTWMHRCSISRERHIQTPKSSVSLITRFVTHSSQLPRLPKLLMDSKPKVSG